MNVMLVYVIGQNEPIIGNSIKIHGCWCKRH